MKRAILTLCIVMVSFPALAINRYNVTTMTCQTVQQTVQRDGAAILRWTSKRNPGLPLYDRFVRNRLYCGYNEYPEVSFVPSRDKQNCPVRKCTSKDFDNGFN